MSELEVRETPGSVYFPGPDHHLCLVTEGSPTPGHISNHLSFHRRGAVEAFRPVQQKQLDFPHCIPCVFRLSGSLSVL